MNSQIEETEQFPSRQINGKFYMIHHREGDEHQRQRDILKAARVKRLIYEGRTVIRQTDAFLAATMKALEEKKNTCRMPRENNCQFRILYPTKLFLRHTEAECVFHQHILTRRISNRSPCRDKESNLRRVSEMQKGLVGKENLKNHSCNVEIVGLKKGN